MRFHPKLYPHLKSKAVRTALLKIKQEASGLPEIISLENVHKYIESYQRNEGISLRENDIK